MEENQQATLADDSATSQANAHIAEIESQIRQHADVVEQVRQIVPSTGPNNEITAATVGRMMGLATVTEVKLLESKLDLLGTKISNITTRLEKALAILQRAPSGADLERIDVQIGALRTLVRDTLAGVAGEMVSQKTAGAKPNAAGAKPSTSGIKIMTNSADKKEESGA